MTLKCKDSDHIPRCSNAGKILKNSKGENIQIMHNGIKVIAGGYYGKWMQDLILKCKGIHEPQEEAFFYELMKHISYDATMIEIGGYWSYYSIWFLKSYQNFLISKFKKKKRSIIVEPEPLYLEIGKKNASLNECTIEFLNAFAGSNYSRSEEFIAEKSGRLLIPKVSVSYLLEEYSINYLDILHIDCQGAELDILKSCHELVKKIGWIFVSTHSHHISGDFLTHQKCLNFLSEIGANIIVEHDVHESYSGDGFICAKFGEIPKKWKQPTLSYNRYSSSLFRNPLFDLEDQKNNHMNNF
jgi:FkbM family methyltransferase